MKKNSKPKVRKTATTATAKPPRFGAAITEEELKQTIINCESWDKTRHAMLALLTKDSKELLHDYQGDQVAAGNDWIDTMNRLNEYHAHLVQCLRLTSYAQARITIIGEHLVKGMDLPEQPRTVACMHKETEH